MHKPESVQENGTHQILWDVLVQLDRLISVRRHYLILTDKKKPQKNKKKQTKNKKQKEENKKEIDTSGFYLSVGPQTENKRKRNDREI